MGNIELKQAFANSNANVQGRQLSLEIISEDKVINDLYSYVASNMVGSADRLKIEKLFPDSNV